MPEKEKSESGLSFAPEASTSLLDLTSRCQSYSLPSLLPPSSTNYPAIKTSGSLLLPQAKERPLLESSQEELEASTSLLDPTSRCQSYSLPTLLPPSSTNYPAAAMKPSQAKERPFLESSQEEPEASTSLLGPTSRCQSHSLPSLLPPSSTNHPTVKTSQAKERPLLESSQEEPETSTILLGPTSRFQSHSLPSLLPPSSTNAMQTSGSLLLPQAKERPLLESSQEPTIPVLGFYSEQKRRDIYLTKYALLRVGLGIGGGLIIWLAMRLLTSTQIGNASTPLYFSSLNPEDSAVCGKTGGRIRNRRVVGGDESDYAEWPWTVSLESNQSTRWFQHFCGAVLISRSLALTAAHCVEFVRSSNMSNLRLRLGDHHRYHNKEPDGHVERGLLEIIIHPDFHSKRLENDIALLKIAGGPLEYQPEMAGGPLEYQPNILPICLPQHNNDLAGLVGFITGWGANKSGGQASLVLNEASLPILSNVDCILMFLKSGKKHWISERFVCAGSAKGGKDACDGDSGGPLVIKGEEERWQLVGISSWGNGCGARNRPGVYTRITKFQSWIRQEAESLQSL